MQRVILESPYAGDVERNVTYAKRALRDCINRGEAPIASHLLFPGVLDDTDPAERALGIRAGLAWYQVCDLIVFYADYGWSSGMNRAKARCEEFAVPFEIRYLDASD